MQHRNKILQTQLQKSRQSDGDSSEKEAHSLHFPSQIMINKAIEPLKHKGSDPAVNHTLNIMKKITVSGSSSEAKCRALASPTCELQWILLLV